MITMPKRDKKAEKTNSVRPDNDISIADEYYGIVIVEKWPEDLDEFLAKQMTKNALEKIAGCSENQRRQCSGN
jgi:hypothetical protein